MLLGNATAQRKGRGANRGSAMTDAKEPMSGKTTGEGEKVLEVETTEYDKVVLLRNGIIEYVYTGNPEEPGAPRISANPYYLEDAGFID